MDEISENLKEGCPSYYKESNYHYFLAVEYLEKASVTMNAVEKESLARDAFKLLIKSPEYADLAHLVTICKRFADLRLVTYLAIQLLFAGNLCIQGAIL